MKTTCALLPRLLCPTVTRRSSESRLPPRSGSWSDFGFCLMCTMFGTVHSTPLQPCTLFRTDPVCSVPGRRASEAQGSCSRRVTSRDRCDQLPLPGLPCPVLWCVLSAGFPFTSARSCLLRKTRLAVSRKSMCHERAVLLVRLPCLTAFLPSVLLRIRRHGRDQVGST